MEVNQRLSERMADDTIRFSPDDQNWNQFVRDHKNYIRAKCTPKVFTPEKMVGYRYRPEEFFVDNGGIVQATWIWMFINDIRDITEFTEARTQFLMFTWDIIKELFETYRATENSETSTAG